MSKSNIDKLLKLIDLEKKRSQLAKKKRFKQLLTTYKSASLENKNSGIFWDNKFNEKKIITNYVEKDRNIQALKILSRVIVENSRILNVGCGDGKFESLITRLPSGAYYEGMDFAENSIRKLRKQFKEYHFWVGDITKTKIGKKYDVICIFEVLEHISSYKVFRVLRKLNSSLNNGGYMLVAVPLNESLLKMFPQNPNEHVRLYSKELIRAELEIAGFEILETWDFIAFESLYYLKKMLSKTLLRKRWNPNDTLILARKK